jgi:hypothetical protein
MAKLHENIDILVPMDSWNPNFDNGSRKYIGSFIMEIIFSIYYVIHN